MKKVSAAKFSNSLNNVANNLNNNVRRVVKNEMAINLDDIMLRRSRCLFLDVEESIKIAPKIVKIMSKELILINTQ